MFLTEEQKDKILTTLGYPNQPRERENSVLSQAYTLAAYSRAIAIVDVELPEIEAELRSIRPNYMAQQVGGTTVNFVQQRALLLADKSRLLQELAQLVGVSLVAKLPSPSIVSYW